MATHAAPVGMGMKAQADAAQAPSGKMSGERVRVHRRPPVGGVPAAARAWFAHGSCDASANRTAGREGA